MNGVSTCSTACSSRIVKAIMIATVMNFAVDDRRIGFASTLIARSGVHKTTPPRQTPMALFK
jgi:hypothetical protein